MFYSKPISLLAVIVLFISSNIFGQEYLTVTGTAGKKEFQQSENIRINLKAGIQGGFHVNANKIDDDDLIPTTVTVNEGDFKVKGINWPPAKSYKFEFSETELKVFEGTVNIGVNLKAKQNIKPGKYEVSGVVNYQACNDRSCFAPKDAKWSVEITIKEDSVKTSDTTAVKKDSTEKKDSVKTNTTDTSKTNNLKENKRDTSQTVTTTEKKNEIADYIQSKGIFLTLLLIFLGGLALNLTPCVYPLIPITISFFGAHGSGGKGKGQKVTMALVYVLGMSITYSILGVVAALTGGLFGSLLQNPLVVAVFVLILLALALSMFGVYEIRIPQFIANFSGKNRSGYVGTALMGLTVGFIAAPCIGPFVLSLLVYVGQIGNVFLGFLMFFVLAVGLGFPYIFLALFSGSITKLPRSGAWMEGVKIIFGLLMIGMAIYTARPLMRDNIYEFVFPLYLILAGVYLILIDKKAITAKTYTRIKQMIAIGGIIYGAMNLQFGEEQTTGGKFVWQDLNTLPSIEMSIKNANGKPTMIDFYADWCAQCKELDKYTYIDGKIIEEAKRFNNIKVDLTKSNKDIESKYKIQGLPVVAFIDANGKEREDLRVTGFLKPEEFIKIMEKIK